MQDIRIENISQDDKRITLVDGRNKYTFWRKKQDGTETKAYQQFKKYGFEVGTRVSAEVKEEPASFTGKDGKTVNFTRRTVLYFQEVDNLPVTRPEAPQGKLEATTGDIKLTNEQKLERLWEDYQERVAAAVRGEEPF